MSVDTIQRTTHRFRNAFLAIALTACACASARAQSFTAYTWGYSNTTETPNLWQMVWITQTTSLDLSAIQLSRLPAGKRYVMMFYYVNDLADNPADRCRIRLSTGGTILSNQRGPWMDKGIATVKKRMQRFVQGMRSRGAQIDAFVFDNETTLHATNFMSVSGAWSLIQGDPRWRTLANSMGLPQDISSPSVMYWGSPLYYQWTEKMAGRFDAAMNTAVYNPIVPYYPGARVITNYESYRMVSPFETPDVTGKLDRYDTTGFGTDDSAEFYGLFLPGRLEATNTGPLPNAGLQWVALRANIHKSRGIYFANPLRPKDAWISPLHWDVEWDAPGVTAPLIGSAYWAENVLQLAMNGIDTFLYWNADAWLPQQNPALFNTPEDRHALDDLLAELNVRVGSTTATTLRLAMPSYADRVIASARQSGSNMVWRFSFDAGIAAAIVYFTDGTTAIIAPEATRPGCWLTYPTTKSLQMAPGGALPVMTLIPS